MDRRIGKYRILRELGRGGMGVVYLALDESLDREVAIKIIRPGLHIEERGLERFKREARAAAHLSHPHVAHVNALHEIDGQIVIEMPYLSGGSLRDRVRAGMSIGGLARTLDQVLQALECCHAANIVHRDVKPSNILFDDLGFAKLSDFGAATLAAEELGGSVSRDATTFIGTPRYACPESWDRGAPAPAWDLFSLGVLAWEALAGELPDSKLSPLAFLRQLHQKPLPPLREAAPEVSDEFAGLINSLCAHDPDDRPASAAEARRLLLAAPEMEGVSSASDVTAQIRQRRRLKRLAFRDQITRTIRKSRRHTIPAVVSLAAGAVLTAWWYAQFSPESGAAALPEAQIIHTQAEVFAERIPNVDQILAADRLADGARTDVYDIVAADETNAEDRLLMAADDSGARGLGVLDGNVVLFRLIPAGEGIYDVEGVWGTYREAQRRALLFGRIEGHARESERVAGSIRFTLTYFSDVTIESWDESFLATPTISSDTDSKVIHRWEDDASVFPVLTREILPRFRDYADVAETFVPVIAGAWLETELLNAGSRIMLDGALDERFWQAARIVKPIPSSVDAGLSVVSSPSGLVLGLRLPGSFHADDAVSVVVLPGYDVPRDRSGHLSARMTAAGADGTWSEHEVSVPVDNLLQLESTSGVSGATEIEIRVPVEALGRTTPPVQGEIFRLNVRVDRSDGALVWGWPNVQDVAHGLLIRFMPKEQFLQP